MVVGLEEFRAGTVRESMLRNRLIAKDELGKPKKVLFNNPPDSLVFGMPKQKEEESVRDVVFMWKDNETSLDAAPGPDFRSMDKSAVHMGLTKSPEFRDFRKSHHMTLRTGRAGMRSTRSILPSDMDPAHTYGCPSSYKPLEEFRRTGEDCSMQDLIQGKFQFEWAAHATGDMAGGTHAHRVVGKPTLAQMGHQRGAAERMRRLEASAGGPGSPNTASLKLTKFLKVESKVKDIIHPHHPPAAAPGAVDETVDAA